MLFRSTGGYIARTSLNLRGNVSVKWPQFRADNLIPKIGHEDRSKQFYSHEGMDGRKCSETPRRIYTYKRRYIHVYVLQNQIIVQLLSCMKWLYLGDCYISRWSQSIMPIENLGIPRCVRPLLVHTLIYRLHCITLTALVYRLRNTRTRTRWYDTIRRCFLLFTIKQTCILKYLNENCFLAVLIL